MCYKRSNINLLQKYKGPIICIEFKYILYKVLNKDVPLILKILKTGKRYNFYQQQGINVKA